MKPKTLKLARVTRTYSVLPVPTTRSVRESMRASAHIQMTISAAENSQYETSGRSDVLLVAIRVSSRPSQAICVPYTTQMSTRKSVMRRLRA